MSFEAATNPQKKKTEINIANGRFFTGRRILAKCNEFRVSGSGFRGSVFRVWVVIHLTRNTEPRTRNPDLSRQTLIL